MQRPEELTLDGVKPVKYGGDAPTDRFVFALDNVVQHAGEENHYSRLLRAR